MNNKIISDNHDFQIFINNKLNPSEHEQIDILRIYDKNKCKAIHECPMCNKLNYNVYPVNFKYIKPNYLILLKIKYNFSNDIIGTDLCKDCVKKVITIKDKIFI